MAKLHPHVKHFLRSIIYTELNDSIPKNQKKDWREGLLEELQVQIFDESQNIQSKEELEEIVERVVDRFKREKIDRVFSVASAVLKATPLHTLRKEQP